MFSLQQNDEAPISILGFGADFGSSGLKGCELAPEVLKKLSAISGNSKNIIDIGDQKKLFDQSHVSVRPFLKYDVTTKTESFLQGCEIVLNDVLNKNKYFNKSTVISLGGDHLISYPLIKGFSEIYSNIQVIQLDAHFDSNSISDQSQPAHHNFVSFLEKESKFGQWIFSGQRGLTTQILKSKEKMKFMPINNIINSIDVNAPVYLTIDLDVIDSLKFPSVSFPQPGLGLDFQDILNLVDQLVKNKVNIVGIDICEYNPKLDLENYLYGRQVCYFLAQIISKIKQGIYCE